MTFEGSLAALRYVFGEVLFAGMTVGINVEVVGVYNYGIGKLVVVNEATQE